MVPTSYVNVLDKNEVSIMSASLDASDTTMEREAETEPIATNDVEEIWENVFDASQPSGRVCGGSFPRCVKLVLDVVSA